MKACKPVHNLLFPKVIESNNYHKVLKCVFQVIHVFLALDFGFFRHKSLKFQSILICFSLLQCVSFSVSFFCVIYYREIVDLHSIWSCISIIEDLIAILILSFFKSNTTLCNLHNDLKQIDAMLKANNLLCNLDIYVLMSIVCCFFQRCTVTLLHFFTAAFFLNPFWMAALVLINFSVDILLICYTFIFYSLSCRLSKLLTILETEDFDYVQRVYKSIVDTVEKYKASYDSVFMLLLLFNIPKLMATIFYTLTELQNNKGVTPFDLICLEYFHVLLVFVLTIAPALAAEKMSTHAEKIKVKLHDRRLDEDNNQNGNIMRFISYIEARPCRYYVWKIIPLNANLLGMLLSFCATYLIVIIQLTHTY